MQADFVLDYNSIPIDQPQKVYLMARCVSGPAQQNQKRRPLNLSLVIDRSGSMAGEKLDFTRQAAQFLVQNLGVQDTFSIVLYNEQVEILLNPEKVQRKDIINQRIASIKARGTTNLSAGWLEGCKLVVQNIDDNALNRVILMSDGLANRGITNMHKLTAMAEQKLGEKISTTTMGMGNDFNEDLLMEMSHAGGGAYYYIESPEVAPLIFKEELSDLLKVIGQNLTVTIEPGRYINGVKQLNAYPMQTDGKAYTFRLGDVFADEIKAILIELNIPAISEAGQKQIALLRFEYDELKEEKTEHRVIELPITLVVHDPVESNDIIVVNPEVTQSVLLLQAAQTRREAVDAADIGEFKTAANMLREMATHIADSQFTDPKLLEEQVALREQAKEIEKGATRYDKQSRKSMSTQALYSMVGRHDHTVQLRDREKLRQTASSEQVNPAHVNEAAQVTRRKGITPTHVNWGTQTFELKGDLIRIGRSQHNEIVILAKGVSRFHCQISRKDEKLLIEDTGSTNGTMIDGVLIKKPHQLSVGDVVYICDEKLIFHEGTV